MMCFVHALAQLFCWSVLHSHCGGVIMWSDHELLPGDLMMAGHLVRHDGSAPEYGEAFGDCPHCGEILLANDAVAGWRDFEFEAEAPAMRPTIH